MIVVSEERRSPALTGRAEPSSPVKHWFRRGLWVASALAAIVLLCYVATMLWAVNELSPPESVVSAQSLMLAHDGTLYYDLKHYPFTVCAYMPSFYWLESGLIRAGLSAFHAGRWISFAALLGLIAPLYRRSPCCLGCVASRGIELVAGIVGNHRPGGHAGGVLRAGGFL